MLATVLMSFTVAGCGDGSTASGVDASSDADTNTFELSGVTLPTLAAVGRDVFVLAGSPGPDRLPALDGTRVSLNDGTSSRIPRLPSSDQLIAVSVVADEDSEVLVAATRCAKPETITDIEECSAIEVITARLGAEGLEWAQVPFTTPDDVVASMARGPWPAYPTLTRSPDGRSTYLSVLGPVVGVNHLYRLADGGDGWKEQPTPPVPGQMCATNSSVIAMANAPSTTPGVVTGFDQPAPLVFSELVDGAWTNVPSPLPPTGYAGSAYLVCGPDGGEVVASTPDRAGINMVGIRSDSTRSIASLEKPQTLAGALGTAGGVFAFGDAGEVVRWPGAQSEPSVQSAFHAAPLSAAFVADGPALAVVEGDPGVADNSTPATSSRLLVQRL